MKKVRSIQRIALLGVACLGLAGCQPVASPLAGVFYNDTKYGWLATTESAATKEGKACAVTIMGLFATGDASITAAKADGGVTKVAHVDHTAKNILGVFAQFCTIVKGS